MSLLASLWLPILFSRIAVFIASAAAWALSHHKSDWSKLSDEDSFEKTLGDLNISTAIYISPCHDSPEAMKSDTYKQRMQKGPWGTLTMWRSAPIWVKLATDILVFSGCQPAHRLPGFDRPCTWRWILNRLPLCKHSRCPRLLHRGDTDRTTVQISRCSVAFWTASPMR